MLSISCFSLVSNSRGSLQIYEGDLIYLRDPSQVIVAPTQSPPVAEPETTPDTSKLFTDTDGYSVGFYWTLTRPVLGPFRVKVDNPFELCETWYGTFGQGQETVYDYANLKVATFDTYTVTNAPLEYASASAGGYVSFLYGFKTNTVTLANYEGLSICDSKGSALKLKLAIGGGFALSICSPAKQYGATLDTIGYDPNHNGVLGFTRNYSVGAGVGFDIGSESIVRHKMRGPARDMEMTDVYALPFEDWDRIQKRLTELKQ